jgi:hypothetical protein
MYTKTYIYIVCQNLDLYHIAKLRFIRHTKPKIYTVYQTLDFYNINLAFGMRYQFRF